VAESPHHIGDMAAAEMDTRRGMNQDETGAVFGKRVLVEVSHTIEQFALAAPPDEPLVVIALFQKLSYFERETAVYRDIAARGGSTIVGLTEDFPPHLPLGVRHALFGADDPLSREWSVTVLGPHGGATLVAHDLETLDPEASTLEQGRLFHGHWSFRRDDAYREVLRLRSALRLPTHVVAEIDEHLGRVVTEPEPDDQGWREAPLRFTTERIDRLLRERAAFQDALAAAGGDVHERDPRSGLHNERYLARWTAGLGSGTLPIGLALLRVFGVTRIRGQYGLRAELGALQAIAGCLQSRLGGADRAVRLTGDDFLLVLPGRSPQEMLSHCEAASAEIARLDRSYPFITLPTAAAATVTRRRPLPLDRLVDRIETVPDRSAALVVV
jgi:GGDEF domain-containing protein/DICT domain-containing protein